MINERTHEFHVERKQYENNHKDLEFLSKLQPTIHHKPFKTSFPKNKVNVKRQTPTKLQHFIAALAKVRFLKLVKIGRHFCMKCYNFTSLFSYMQKPKPVVKRILKELEKRISSNIQMGCLTQ